MTIEDGTYRIVPAGSRADIAADAPGHKFRAAGSGLEGEATIEAGRLTRAEASFPLWQLDAGDPLSNRELKKFLSLKEQPTIRGRLAESITLDINGDRLSGRGTIHVDLVGQRTDPIPIRFEGDRSRVTIHVDASFTRFGYKPPKILFIKVKDPFQLDLTCQIERIDG